jgi:threonine/homoserine/homoserine lactone efflux protein
LGKRGSRVAADTAARGGAWLRYGVPAAVSVAFGCLVAVLTNLATAGGAGASTLGGLTGGVLAWAGWEAWRAVRAADRGDGASRGG